MIPAATMGKKNGRFKQNYIPFFCATLPVFLLLQVYILLLFLAPSKLAPTIMILTCIWEASTPNLHWISNHAEIFMVFCKPYKQLPGYCEVYHSLHFCMLPTTSKLQPNAHYVFATYIFFLPNLSYMFRCVIHHPHGELRVLAQNCQLLVKRRQFRANI